MRGASAALSREEVEQQRTAADLLPWAERRISELGRRSTGNLSLRFGRGLAKKLKEEAFPLGVFVQHHFESSEDVLVRLLLGNQNYDAEILDRRLSPSPIRYLEVTQAQAGEDEFLRMKLLTEAGHVSASGAVRKTGTKKSGFRIVAEAPPLNGDAETQLELVVRAIDRKNKKSYPEGTALVVAFDDSVGLDDADALASMCASLQAKVRGLTGFCWFALVAIHRKRVVLEADLRG